MKFNLGSLEQTYSLPGNFELIYEETLMLAETAGNAGERTAPLYSET
jgi:hypothetical protein